MKYSCSQYFINAISLGAVVTVIVW